MSIEDPFGDDDWDAWQAFTAAAGKRLQIVGDDLFVTNVGRLDKGIDGGAANALLAKVNQVGTLSEALDAMQGGGGRLRRDRVAPVGRAEDTTIADPGGRDGVWADQRPGSLARGERTAKYNRLLAIRTNSAPAPGTPAGKRCARIAK